MADFLGAVLRSDRILSAVSSLSLRPKYIRDVSTASLSNSSLSKTLRRSMGGGVERGVRCGFVPVSGLKNQ